MTLTSDQLAQLAQDFPAEALSADTSRGFELTSIKAAYVIERLNQVFGMCGQGWRYAHSPVDLINGEYVAEVLIQYRLENGTFAFMWMDGHLTPIGNETWSEPIFAYGGKKPIGKGSGPITDAHKSTVTDGLTKAASMLGVGHNVFKGNKGIAPRKPADRPAPRTTSSASKTAPTRPVATTDDKPDGPTAFYNAAASTKVDGKYPDNVMALARQAQSKDITWEQALAKLGDL